MDVEDGLIVNNKKNVYIKHSGKKYEDHIDWYLVSFDKLKGSTVTHNHPTSSGLSLADLEFFLFNELREIRAVGKNKGVFSLKDKGITPKVRNEIIEKIGAKKKAFDEVYDVRSEFRAEVLFRNYWDELKDFVDYTHFL